MLDGKGQCPFDPQHTYTALLVGEYGASGLSAGLPWSGGRGWGVLTMAQPPLCPWADGELYAGTMNNFQGNEPIISRSLGTRTLLKTDAFLRWLSGEQREGAAPGEVLQPPHCSSFSPISTCSRRRLRGLLQPP